MNQLQEVLDLSIVFTKPPPYSSPEILAQVALQCDVLDLSHTGEVFTDPLTEAERDDLRWYLEEYWQWPYLEFAERGKRVEALLDDVGKRFYHALFGSREAQNIVQAWQQHMNVQHRISIVSEIASILRLPWELLSDPQGFLVLHVEHPISIVRRLPTQGEQASLTTPFQPPLRILLVTARPEDAGFVDPRSISRELVDELQRQSEIGTIELEFLRPPTFSALRARLKDTERPIHVLHFDGHGGLDSKAQQGILLFETNAGKRSPVKASDMAKVLSTSGVRLAVLTACQSAMNTEDDAFSSISTQLINNGVDAVIAMSSSILVTSAALYVEAFYHALAEGLPVSIAQEQARQVLQKDSHRHLFRRHQDEEAAPVTLADWWVPHFYQQRPFILQATRAPRKRQPAQLVPARFDNDISKESYHHFSGRARELLQIERHLLHKRLVVISGFGGVGKTALAREAADWLTRTGVYTSTCFVSFEHGGDVSLLLGMLGTFLGLQEGQYNASNSDAALALLTPALVAHPTLVIGDNLESLLPCGEAPLERADRAHLWHVLRELARLGVGILLTSRDPLVGEDQLAPGVHVSALPLDGLVPDDAYALATGALKDLGIDRARVPYTELRDLLTQLDHHPLAIRLVLPTLLQRSLDTIRTDFASLLPTFTDDTTTGRNRSLLASLDYSLRCLTDAQRTFLPRLAFFEGGASEEVLLAVTEIPKSAWAELRQALEQAALLTVEHLADINVPFLHFHPVLTPSLRSHQKGADAALHERYAKLYADLAVSLHNEDYQHPHGTRALVRKELPNLRRALEMLLEAGELEAASSMADIIAKFLTSFGLLREREEVRRCVGAAVAVQRSQEQDALTRVVYLWESGLSNDEREQGNLRAAFVRLSNLLVRMEALPEGAPLGRSSYEYCMTLAQLARCSKSIHQPAVAEEYLRKAFVVIEALLTQEPEREEYLYMRDVLLTDLADVLTGQGKYMQARDGYEQSLERAKQSNDPRGQAGVLEQLGTLALLQRDSSAAQAFYTAALHFFQTLDEPAREATLWHQLGMVAEEQQDNAKAEHCYRESLAGNERVGDFARAARTCNQLGIVARKSGHPGEAEGWYRRALEFFGQTDHGGSEQASVLQNLANLFVGEVKAGRASTERLVEAKRYADQALAMKETLDISERIWTTLHILAQIAEMEGQAEEARKYHRRERETFAAFAGNRYEIDRQFAPLIAAIAAGSGGDRAAQAEVEATFPDLETWNLQITAATRRLWAGERDWYALTENTDRNSALIILRVLETKPRHGWFTNPGSDVDRCPMHQDGGKIFLCSEQIIVVIGLFQ